MSIQALLILIYVLAAILTGLYVFIILTKIAQARREKVRQVHLRAIMPGLEGFFAAPDSGRDESMRAFVQSAHKKIKQKAYRTALESVLLEYLEEPDKERRQRILSLSYALGLPRLCLPQIGSRSNRNVAFGCRKAGLYRCEDAVPYILGTLSILSSDTQFQILMGLSRIGDANAMYQAFHTISQHVIVNERAVSEILKAFAGDKHALYKHMIHCEEEYITTLFLKSLDKDLAAALAGDIVEVLNGGGKEVRIAAIKALGKIEHNVSAYPLRRALGDSEWEVRAIAAKALGVLIDPDAGEALASALRDPEWWVRQNAALSLLAYPDCEKLIASAVQTGDAYARDSIVYALENSERRDILSKLQSVLTSKKTSLAVSG